MANHCHIYFKTAAAGQDVMRRFGRGTSWHGRIIYLCVKKSHQERNPGKLLNTAFTCLEDVLKSNDPQVKVHLCSVRRTLNIDRKVVGQWKFDVGGWVWYWDHPVMARWRERIEASWNQH